MPVVEQLKEVLGTHPGVTEVRLRLMTKTSTTVMRLDDRLRVAASPALFADLKALLGPNCLAGCLTRLMPDSSRAAARDVAVVLGVLARARGAVRRAVVGWS